MKRIVVFAAVAAMLGAGCAAAPAGTAGMQPARPTAADEAQTRAQRLVPPGYGTLRQDDVTLTLSATSRPGGPRRPLNARVRVQMFRNATRLGIVDLRESIRVMAISALVPVPSGSPPAVR